MRLVLDLQAGQGTSRTRGIGRYALELGLALARRPRGHEIWLALNARMGDTVDAIQSKFEAWIPRARMPIFQLPDTHRPHPPCVSEYLREAFLADLRPDVVHVMSVFEEDSRNVFSLNQLGRTFRSSATLHDLIPFLDQATYLPQPHRWDYYMRRLAWLKQADLVLAVSDSSRREAIRSLNLPANRVVTTRLGVSDRFAIQTPDQATRTQMRTRHGVDGPFMLNIGSKDPNKNLPRLLEAHARLEPALRQLHPLVIVCELPGDVRSELLAIARSHGAEGELILPGFVSDEDLVALYRCAHLVVCPSVHEGFGLPALEAMACGTPVIAANSTSLPEVMGWVDALFDPHDPASIAAKMQEALTDQSFYAKLKAHALRRAGEFSWDRTAEQSWDAWEALIAREDTCVTSIPASERYSQLLDAVAHHAAPEAEWGELAACIASNRAVSLEA